MKKLNNQCITPFTILAVMGLLIGCALAIIGNEIMEDIAETNAKKTQCAPVEETSVITPEWSGTGEVEVITPEWSAN